MWVTKDSFQARDDNPQNPGWCKVGTVGPFRPHPARDPGNCTSLLHNVLFETRSHTPQGPQSLLQGNCSTGPTLTGSLPECSGGQVAPISQAHPSPTLASCLPDAHLLRTDFTWPVLGPGERTVQESTVRPWPHCLELPVCPALRQPFSFS